MNLNRPISKRFPFPGLARIVAFALVLTLMSFKKGERSFNLSVENMSGINDSSKSFKSLIAKVDEKDHFAGKFELNTSAKIFTDAYLARQAKNYKKMKEWCEPYFTLYGNTLSSFDLPAELKYLSVIESGLQSGAISCRGAAGPWQLMPDEARRYGLKVSSNQDELTNIQKSTVAAAKLLKELYEIYQDWLLVIAAYNCGKGGVNRAITKSGSKDFWRLQPWLPEETRNHVKKYIATHYYFEGMGGPTTVTALEIEKVNNTHSLSRKENINIENVLTEEISGRYLAQVILKNIDIDTKLFHILNSEFDDRLCRGKSFLLRLPAEEMEIFKLKKEQILQESVLLLFQSAQQ